MHLTLLYSDDCPNWRQAHDHVRQALRLVGATDGAVTLQRVTTAEQAKQLNFRGSPTILIDGQDMFAQDDQAAGGLSCRVFRTPDGLGGAPTVDQVVDALRKHAPAPTDQDRRP